MLANYYIPTKLTGLVAHIGEQRADQPLRWQILPSVEPGSFHQKARWLEELLYKRITETADLHAAFKIKKVVEAFAANPENQNRTLLDLTGYSRSHTHRLFTDWFGLAPTHHLQLTQFINALQSLHNPFKRLTQIAYEHGYYDQAHFIRAFKQFTDMTPKQYRKNMTGIVCQLDSWR